MHSAYTDQFFYCCFYLKIIIENQQASLINKLHFSRDTMIGDTKVNGHIYFTLILLLLIFTISCGSSRTIQSSEESTIKKIIPLEKKYRKIIIQKFEFDPQLGKDYPDAIIACESTAINELLRKSSVPQIEKTRFGSSREAGALIIKTRINILRIVSSSARSWGGAFAGSSEMAVHLKLIDAATGQIVREKNLSTANNAYAAHWTGGSSDRTLPSDLGKMIAEYITEAFGNKSR